MALIQETLTLYKREMLIFKANLRANMGRSIIFPFVIIFFFGNIGNSINHTPIAIVNYANNLQSNQFISELQSSESFTLYSVTNEQNALSMLQTGQVQMVVILLPNFPGGTSGPASIDVYYSNTQPTVVASALASVEQYARNYGQVRFNDSATSPIAAPKSTGPTSGTVVSNALYAAQGNYIDFLTGGILAMVVVFSAIFGGGIAFISDRQSGIVKAFLITPINKNAIVLSRILSGATQSLLSAFIALAIGLLFGVTVAMGALALVYIFVVIALLGIGFSGMAMALAAKIRRVDVFAIFAQAVGLPLWFISGGIVPISSLPSFLIPISAIDPLTYAASVSRAVIMQGFIATPQLLTDLAALTVFAVVMVTLGFRSFKSTIE